MPSVYIKENESFDFALRRFKRSCEKAGVLGKLRQVEYYEKPTTCRKRQHAASIKRWQKKLQKDEELLLRNRAKHPKTASSQPIALLTTEAPAVLAPIAEIPATNE